jgi:hypothetical protein
MDAKDCDGQSSQLLEKGCFIRIDEISLGTAADLLNSQIVSTSVDRIAE